MSSKIFLDAVAIGKLTKEEFDVKLMLICNALDGIGHFLNLKENQGIFGNEIHPNMVFWEVL